MRGFIKWRTVKWIVGGLAIGGLGMAIYTGEVWVPRQIEYTAQEVQVVEKVVEVEKDLKAPVLERICKAESGGNHFCTAELVKMKKYKDCYEGRIGMPLMNVNDDGTVDWGICQINDYHWGAEARKLKFDIMTLEGNMAMAEWIFLNHGTDAWNASKKNWK